MMVWNSPFCCAVGNPPTHPCLSPTHSLILTHTQPLPISPPHHQQGALAVAEPIVEDARAASAGGGGLLLSSSLITQVSLYYHIGLSYLMIRK